jgi:hypothetical protein
MRKELLVLDFNFILGELRIVLSILSFKTLISIIYEKILYRNLCIYVNLFKNQYEILVSSLFINQFEK